MTIFELNMYFGHYERDKKDSKIEVQEPNKTFCLTPFYLVSSKRLHFNHHKRSLKSYAMYMNQTIIELFFL